MMIIARLPLLRRLGMMIGGEAMQSGFHFALNLVRAAKDTRSIKLRRKLAAWTPDYLDRLLRERVQ